MNVVKKHRKIYVRILISIILAICIFLYVFFKPVREIFNIVLISIIVAYILKPLRNILTKKLECKNSTASLIIIFGIILILLIGLFICIPLLFKELNNIGPTFEKIYNYIDKIGENSKISESAFVRFIYEEGKDKLTNLFTVASQGIVEKVIAVGENVLAIAVVPVVTYYMLADSDWIMKKVYLFIPLEKRQLVKNIIIDIDKLLGRYIVSQILLSIIIGILSFIVLILLRVRFPLWLSVLNGLFNIIPYFGPLLGMIPITFIALLDSPVKAIWATIAMIIIQQIEGNILSPKITGDSTDIHPLIIIVLLLIGENLGGFLGMIFIIPLAVIIKVVYDDINYYLF